MITILLRIGRNPCKIARGRSAFNPSYFPPLDCGPTELHLTTPAHLLRAARFRRTRRAVALAPLLLIGCRDGYAAFGAGARARSTADQLLTALADRHVDLAQNGKYEYSRMQMMRGALSPSRVFDDTAVWTGASGDVRILESFGSHLDGHYRLDSRAGAPMPTKPADARHVITLSRLAEKEYRWDTTVDFALGAIRPVDVASLVTRLLASGEGRGEAELRSELATLSPRSSAALGTLFTLDSLRPVALADGSTSVTLGASVHSDNLRPRFPAFADYAHRYVDPARFHVVLTDRAGVPFFDAAQKDRVVTVRVRTLHGRLIPLSGPARPLPDSLQLHVDLNVKVKIFHVGFHNLVMDFTNGAVGDEERDWTVTARREPQWDLPLISARLLRSPLRRPFAGEGSLFRLGVRAGEGNAPTVLLRHSRLPVQESAILNFLNSLSGTAMGDFGGVVEREENAWLRELFLALRADARGGIPGP